MDKVVNLYDAKTNLSRLVEEAAGGAEIVIARAGKPRARLVALAARTSGPRVPGRWQGKLWMSEDFDAPLPRDLEDAFYNDGELEPEPPPTR